MKKVKLVPLLIILAVAVLIFFVKPFNLDSQGAFILASLIFTVAAWATQAIHKTWASLYLLLVFMLWGNTPPLEVINFLWSPSMLLIISTSILSLAIVQSRVLEKPLAKALRWSAAKTSRILFLPYILGLVLIFIIPQAFARVSILGTLLFSLLQGGSEEAKEVRSVIIFHACLAITMTYMFFTTGDIVLNGSALNFSGAAVAAELDFSSWFKYMSIPTLFTCLGVIGLTYLLFRKEFQAFGPQMLALTRKESEEEKSPESSQTGEAEKSKKLLFVISLILLVIAWMTESIHGVAPWICTVVVLLLAYLLGYLKADALKAVNPNFLIFLTAAFSIAKVLANTGVTEKIFEYLQELLPQGSGQSFLILCAALVMLLHLFIGSSVATLSVTLPILLPIAEKRGISGAIICLIFYFVVNVHFLLPFHHATMMLGAGQGYYQDKHMLRFGIPMTAITLIFLYLFYYPWWQFLGLI